MKLPAPALACACPGCKRQLNKDFAEIIRRSFTADDIIAYVEIARIGEMQHTIAEALAPYTVKR